MKYNQKKKKENIEIFLFIMVMAVFAAVLGVMSLGEDAAGEPDQEDIFWLVLL